jgi:GNAT superfamily N-acetyltransferase
VRIARIEERAALIELQRRASLANPGDRAVLEAHPEAIDTPREQFEAGQVVVADVGGEVAGFAAYLPRADGAFELDALFVEPAMWRRGIARVLIGYGRDLARGSGAPAIHVIGNPHARDFYLALGFGPAGTAETQFGPATEYVLTLALPGAP